MDTDSFFAYYAFMYPSFWQIVIVLAILLLLFGHKRVREFGKSLGEGLRDFKKGLEGESKEDNKGHNKEDSKKDSSITARTAGSAPPESAPPPAGPSSSTGATDNSTASTNDDKKSP